MARFTCYPDQIRDDFAGMSAAERIAHILGAELPDDEIGAPIDTWHSSRVAEFGAPLAAELVEWVG